MSRYLERYKNDILSRKKSDCEKNNLLKELADDLDSPKHLDQILTREYVPLLRYLWQYLAPNDGRRLDSHDYSAEKIKFHENALSILNKVLGRDVGKFLLLDVIKPEEAQAIFSLLDVKSAHVGCCFDSFNYTWTRSNTKHAHELLFGTKLQVLSKSVSRQTTRYGEMFDVILATEDGSEMIADMLGEEGICTTPHFRDYQHNPNLTQYCYISHMINPQYVWLQLQEDMSDFQKLQTHLALKQGLVPYCGEEAGNHGYRGEAGNHGYNTSYQAEAGNRVLVRGPDNFTFRGDILPNTKPHRTGEYLILAVDFGWTCRVPAQHVYCIGEEEAGVINSAILCRLIDILPCNRVTRLQLGSLSLLNYLTRSPNWAKQILTPDRLRVLLKLLHNSQNIELIKEVIAIFASVSVNREIAATLKEPVTGQVSKYLECVDVMRSVMLFYYNLMIKSEKIAKMIIRGSGIELLMKIYSKHQSDRVISDYFTLIAKQVFQDNQLEITAGTGHVDDTAVIETVSIPKPTTSVTRHPDYIPDVNNRFCQGTELPREHNIAMGEQVSFLGSLNNAEHRDNLARELSSMLNTSGGTIYIGVDPGQGKIKGLKLTRKDRDDMRLLLDDMITDHNIMSHSKFEKIPESCIDPHFEEINNIFNANLRAGQKLMILIVTVNYRYSKGGLVRFNETKDKAGDAGGYSWAYYGRSDAGRFILGLNEIRQLLAEANL